MSTWVKFLKATRKTVRGKTYTNHLLVESISTPKGPRHHTICSLGALEPAPREHWLALAHKLQAALVGERRGLRLVAALGEGLLSSGSRVTRSRTQVEEDFTKAVSAYLSGATRE